MPTYEYACKDCSQHLEVVQSFKDDALTTCPSCSGNLRKVFSAAGIIFKGSGWHVKDYASSSNRTSARDGAASGEGGEGGGDSTGSKDGAGETKTAAATGKDGATPSGSKDRSDTGSGGKDTRSGGKDPGSGSSGSGSSGTSKPAEKKSA